VELKCAACGRRIEGEYYELSNGAGACHQKCYGRLDRCNSCGHRVPPRLLSRLTDGRLQCATCARTGVVDASSIDGIWQPAKRFIERITAHRLKHAVPIRVVGPREIARERNRSFRPERDMKTRAVGVFVQRGERFEILVEKGQPPDVALLTLIHEYGHALLADADIDVSQEESEGFSRWLEYRYLMAYGAVEQAEALAKQDGVYGSGLRLMLEREKACAGRVEYRRLATGREAGRR
jgi:hypothetical protein